MLKSWKESRLFRWSLLFLFLVLTLTALVWFLIPSIVSTDLVKKRFEEALSKSIGQEVRFGTEPKISLWPNANISLGAISVGDADANAGEAILVADSVSADMSVFSAILGEPSFSNYKLTRPTMQLEIYPDGSSNWLPYPGIFGLISGNSIPPAANDNAGADEENSGSTSLFEFQNLTIEGGTVLLITDPGNEPERISSISGNIDFDQAGKTISTDIEAIVRGEKIGIDINELDLDKLTGGEIVPAKIDLASDLINLNYQGELQTGDKIFIKGALSVDTPSVRRAIEWSGSEIKPGAALGAVSLEADISGTLSALKFEDLIVKIGDNRGIGILDYSIDEDEPPVLSGTLAFNSLDIESFLRAFTPLPKSGDEIANTIDTRFLKQLGLDLRLSAQSANFGPLEMSDLAAGVQINKEVATFNIGDATAYGGQLFARLSISDKGIDGGGEISISAKDMDFGPFLEDFAIVGPVPDGNGNLDLKLISDRPLWATDIANISGDIKVSLVDGALPGVDLDEIKILASESRFFSLSDVSDGDVGFESAIFDVQINSGVANIQKAIIKTPDEQIVFRGIVPFAQGSLALRGSVGPVQPEEENSSTAETEAGILSLFIGGSWPDPILSPSNSVGLDFIE